MPKQIEKEGLRKEIRERLKATPGAEIARLSSDLISHLAPFIRQLDANATAPLLAWTATFQGEVDLAKLIDSEVMQRPVYLPGISEIDELEYRKVDGNWAKELKRGPRGILQPGRGEKFDPLNYERAIVLVPGMAFDREGRRLGRGGGYYDRFLAAHQFDSWMTIGVCWSLQIVDEIPAEHHDWLVDYVCIESGLIRGLEDK